MIALYFGDRKDDDELLAVVDLSELVTGKTVVCVRVPKPESIQAAPASVVPTDRLATKDLWSAYGIKQADTFVVADKFGNPYAVTTETALADKMKEVASHFRSLRKQLRRDTDTARAAHEKGQTREAIDALLAAFNHGLTGYDEAEPAAKLYQELMDAGRKQLKQAGDKATELESLAKLYAGTDLQADIDETLKKIRKS